MLGKLFLSYFWLYFSYVVSFVMPLIAGVALLCIKKDRTDEITGLHPRTILGVIFIVIGFLLIQSMIEDLYIFYWHQTYNGVAFSMNFGLALSPLFYFYFRKLMIPRKLNTKHVAFHILPFLAVSAFELLALYVHHTAELPERLLTMADFYSWFYPVPLIVSVVFYVLRVISLRKNYVKGIKENYSFIEGIDLRWINTAVVLYILLMIVTLTSLLIHVIWLKHLFNISFILFVFYMFVQTLNEPHIYYSSLFSVSVPCRIENVFDGGQLCDVSQGESSITEVICEGVAPGDENEKIEIAKWQNIRKKSLKTDLILFFERKKVYLKSTLSINEVAGMLNTNRTYISNLVNSEFGLSFYQFVNKFRIQEAARILHESSHLSMNEVANLVGFNSMSSFIAAFKLHKQCTPKEWKRENSIN